MTVPPDGARGETVAPDPLMGAAVRLATSAEALAALAAHVRVETEGIEVDEATRELLAAIVGHVLGAGAVPSAGASPAGPAVVGLARAFLRQCSDLVEAPGRRGNWSHTDPALLQGLGRLSMAVADVIGMASADLADLRTRLTGPGAAVLDVGTGTGWLAIALARAFPTARVVGLDVFEPALELAAGNVAAEALTDRVELRRLDVADLAEVDAYDAVWLPLPFLPADVVPAAMGRIASALRPGGWLLPGTFAGPDDELSRLLVDLRIVRSGGRPWRPDEVVAMLADTGLADARLVERRWTAPVQLFAARKA
jgi:SAM-dependent methyltransferase